MYRVYLEQINSELMVIGWEKIYIGCPAETDLYIKDFTSVPEKFIKEYKKYAFKNGKLIKVK